MIKKLALKGLFASLLLAAPAVQGATLTFDGSAFSHGTVVDDEYSISHGVTINAVNGTTADSRPDLAVAFNTALTGTLDDDLESPIGAPANLGNVLILQENYTGCSGSNPTTCSAPDDEAGRPAGYFSFIFDQAIELLSLDFIDIESVENGTGPNNRIEVWQFGVTPNGSNGTVVGHTPNLGNNVWGQVLFDTTNAELRNLGRIDVYMGGSGALDNLQYNVVPVPAAFWLFGTALVGFIGYSRRRTI